MPKDFTIARNDTSEDLIATLNDSAGTSFNLTGATVVFNMQNINTGAVKVNRAAATVVDATLRKVKYVWQASNVNTAGDYFGEFEVTFSSGKIATFPNTKSGDEALIIHIVEDIA